MHLCTRAAGHQHARAPLCAYVGPIARSPRSLARAGTRRTLRAANALAGKAALPLAVMADKNQSSARVRSCKFAMP